MPSTLNTSIIGGSIGGCTAAIELVRIGCEVAVYERSGETLKDRGAGIGVPRSVIEAYVERDLVDADLPYFPADSFLRIWRSDADARLGRLAWDQPVRIAALNWGALYRNLRARVPEGCYRTHQPAVKLENLAGGRAAVSFADGSRAESDLIVCADGYASLGRRTLFPEIDFDYAGYVLWRGALMESELEDSKPLERGIHCVGYPGGHGIFYFVPSADGSIDPGGRLVNWGVYVPVAALEDFMTDTHGTRHEGSLPPGSMPPATEAALKNAAAEHLPGYYADITRRSQQTFAYAIYDCEVPAYRRGRICLAGDAGAFARPHSGAGAMKGMADATGLAAALDGAHDIDAALTAWDAERTEANNRLVRFGNQLGRAFVTEIPDWSTMDESAMQAWYESAVTIESDYFRSRR